MSKPEEDSIAVGATSSPNPGLEYKGVDTKSKTTIFRQSLEAGSEQLGDFLAIVHSLRLLQRNNIEVGAIYAKSPEAVRWINNKKCDFFPHNGKKKVKLVEAVKEAEAWLAENSFKTKILLWDPKEWGNINDVVFSNDKQK